MSLPARCDPLREVDGWRLTAVLGDWRGKSLYTDIAWVSRDGRRALTASTWNGGAWGDAEVGWSALDLETGEETARGEARVSQDELSVIWFSDEGDALYGIDEGDRCVRVDLRTGSVMSAYERAPFPRPADWQREMRAARAEPFTWLGEDPAARFALAMGTARGERDALVRVDLSTGAQTWWHQGHSASVAALAFSGDGARLASAARDDTARVWSLRDGSCAWTLELDAMAPPWSLRFEGDGRTLSAWHEGGELVRWDLDDGIERARVVLAARASSPGVLSPDGDLLVTVDRVGTFAWVWDLRGPTPTRARVEIPWLTRVVAAASSADGASITILGHDGERTHVIRESVRRRARSVSVRASADPMASATTVPAAREGLLSDDGARALVVSDEGIHWIDADAPRPRCAIPAPADRAASAYALSASRFARADESGVTLWDDDGRALLRLELSRLGDLATALAISPDGDHLAVGTAQGVVLVYARG